MENKIWFENSANAWGNYWILYHKTNKEDSTVLCSVVKHLGSGRAFACFLFLFLSVSLAWNPELLAKSCKEIKASEGGQLISGKYWFDWIIPGKVILVHCDMETECDTSIIIIIFIEEAFS